MAWGVYQTSTFVAVTCPFVDRIVFIEIRYD